jgi:putative DNA primase/helicase
LINPEDITALEAAIVNMLDAPSLSPENASSKGGDHELRALNAIPTPDDPTYTSVGAFEMADTGLTVTVTKGATTNKTTEIIPVAGPFEVLGLSRDENSSEWGKQLRWMDPDKKVHTYCVRNADLQGDANAVASELARRGLSVSNKHKLVEYLNQVTVANRVTVAPRTGWTDAGAFVLPEQVIGETFGERVILADGLQDDSPFAKRGTLDLWTNNVAALVVGHAIPMFTLSVSFVGPLLKLLGVESGAFHFYGDSSIGKSTKDKAAASVWGRGLLGTGGFIQTWRSTANALEATAALHSDTVLILDELGQADPRDAAAAVYALAGDRGKGRARRDGSLKAPHTWRVLVVSNGEIRLADKLGEARQRARAGQEVRLLDVQADAGKGFGIFDSDGGTGNAQGLADAIQQAASRYYGTAGPAFVAKLIASGLAKDTSRLDAEVADFVTKNVPPGSDPQVKRAAKRFAAVAVAGELAIEFGIVRWAKGSVIGAAERCFRSWVETRGGTEAAEVRVAIEQVRAFLTAHGDSRFERLPTDDRVVSNRVGWRREEGGQEEWLISPEAWKREVCAGLDHKHVARVLADIGALRRDPEDRFSCSERVRGKQMRVYVVTNKLLTLDIEKQRVSGVSRVQRGSKSNKRLKNQSLAPATRRPTV